MHGIDDAGELDQLPVAGGLDDATAVLGKLGVGHFAVQRRQGRGCAFLVGAHHREYPATSAANIAGRRRSTCPLSPAIHCSARPGLLGGGEVRELPAQFGDAFSGIEICPVDEREIGNLARVIGTIRNVDQFARDVHCADPAPVLQ